MNLIAITDIYSKLGRIVGLVFLIIICPKAIAIKDTGQLITSKQIIDSSPEITQVSLPEQYGLQRHSQSKKIGINQAIRTAVNWHPAITEVIAKLLQQTKQVDVASANYYPQINAGINNGYSNSYADGKAKFTPSLVLSVSQVLYDFGKIDNMVAIAKAGVAQEQANVLLTIDNIAHDSAAAAVQIQGYQKLVAIARQQVSSLQQISLLIRKRNEAGASSLSDVMQTDTRIEGAQATLMQSQGALQRFKVTLASYMGSTELPQLTDNIPKAMQAACSKPISGLKQLPAVMMAVAQAGRAKSQLAQANTAMRPTISIEPTVTHYINDNFANNATLNKTQYAAWLRVNMPIYQGGGLTSSRDAAEFSLASAKAAIKTAQLQAKQNLMAAKDESFSLQQSLEVQIRQQTLAERTRSLYQDQYLQLGTRPLLDLLNVTQEIYQAKFSQAQTLIQLRLLDLNCLLNTGNLRKAFSLENTTIQGVEIRQ